MDDGHFDLLTVSFADLRSRRGMVRVLATGALAALGLLSVSSGEARKKKKGNKKKPQCQESETLCGNQCVDLDTNPKHCGECDKECDPGQNCLFGDCVDTCSPVCASPEVCCVADCVDLTSTAEHCGQCFKACAENEVPPIRSVLKAVAAVRRGSTSAPARRSVVRSGLSALEANVSSRNVKQALSVPHGPRQQRGHAEQQESPTPSALGVGLGCGRLSVHRRRADLWELAAA